MIPCLYDVAETEFNTNGIGKLADCISCIVTEKRNGSYELAMEYPLDGIHADSLSEGNIIWAKPSDNASSQPFRIYKINTSVTGNMEIAARHISYQLNYITVSPCSVVTGDSTGQCQSALDALFSEYNSTEHDFSWETDIESDSYFALTEPASLRAALGGVEGSVLDTFGGEYEWDKWTVKLHKSRGADNGVRIVYGKNLVDFQLEKDIGDVITGVHPYWIDSDSGEVYEISEKVVTLSDSSLPYSKIALLDCSSEFEDAPTEDALRSYAQSYLESTTATEPSIDMDIDFAQLWQYEGYADIVEAEHVSLCDTVHVYITKLGITVDATVTETVYDSLLERYNSITVSNSITSSRNSSITMTLATSSSVHRMISYTESSILIRVSDNYSTKAELEVGLDGIRGEYKQAISSSLESYTTTDGLNTILSSYSTTSEVKSLISASASGITLSYSSAINSALKSYTTTDGLNTLLSAYSTTTEVKSLIAASESGITLSYTNTLSSTLKNYTTTDGLTTILSEYATTKKVESLISASEEGILLQVSEDITEATDGMVTTSSVRSAFSMDSTSVTISSGTITFSGTSLVISTNNFNLTSAGLITATSATITGILTSESGYYKTQLSSGGLYVYYNSTQQSMFHAITWASTNYGASEGTIGVAINSRYEAEYFCIGAETGKNEYTYTVSLVFNYGLFTSFSEIVVFLRPVRFNTSLAFSNGYAIRWYDNTSTAATCLYLSSANGFCVGNTSYDTYFYGSDIYVGTRTSSSGTVYLRGKTLTLNPYSAITVSTATTFSATVYFNSTVYSYADLWAYKSSSEAATAAFYVYQGNSSHECQVNLRNAANSHYGRVALSNQGNFGLYDVTNSGWIIRRSISDNVTYILGGTIYMNSSAYGSSDRRLKQNIEELDSRYEALLDAMEPVRFQYIERLDKVYNTGYIAQDVLSAALDAGLTMEEAGLVTTDDEGTYHLAYTDIIALLHMKIKKLETRIASLEGG